MNIDYARQQMVEQQARAWDVFDPDVLEVLRTVPREDFVPEAYREVAFADAEIPIGHGEIMMSSTYQGRILQALEISSDDRVLEVGTGTGYLTACLARLANSVTSIDIHDDFVAAAGQRLEDQGVSNVTLATMDATAELPDGPFDAIAVTGSLEQFDPRFVDSLAPGGRLYVVVGDAPAMEARLVTRTGDNEWSSETLFETKLRRLVNGSLPPQFFF